MKIANVILTSQNGGAEQVFLDYLHVFKKLGHEAFAIIKNDSPYEEKVKSLCVAVRKTSNNFGFYDFIAVRNIKKYLEEFQPDVVFSHSGRSTLLTLKAVAKIKNKSFFTVAVNHSMNVKRSIGADLILSVNKEIFFKTIELGQDTAKSFVMHNATNVSDALEMVPKIELQKKDKIILGVIGRFDKIKSFDVAIRVLKKLQESSEEQKLNKKFILKIAGSGPEEEFLRSLVKELNLEESVEFLNWVQDKKLFFDSIDIFLLTSKRETFGLVLLEAMKFCKPIISTDVDGPREVLCNDYALLVNVIPEESIDDRFVAAVFRVINEPELIQKMLENSLEKVREKFSYESLQARMKEIVG